MSFFKVSFKENGPLPALSMEVEANSEAHAAYLFGVAVTVSHYLEYYYGDPTDLFSRFVSSELTNEIVVEPSTALGLVFSSHMGNPYIAFCQRHGLPEFLIDSPLPIDYYDLNAEVEAILASEL